MLARQTGSGWEVLAPAKLNLYLEILGRRNDGFHELETLMMPIRVFDELRWRPEGAGREPRFALEYDQATPLHFRSAAPADSRNLVWQAFDALARTAGVEPTGRATLVKRIPVQAGLGGASSDAAAALILANQAWGIHYSRHRLSEVGASLGSDVPFFVAGGAAACRGRGERVTPVDGLPKLDLVVVKPPAGVSTAEAFAAIAAGPASRSASRNSRERLGALIDLLRRGALHAAAGRMFNRLYAASAQLCPWIDRVYEALARCGCLGQLMTGSGSACFGVMRSALHARQVARRMFAWKLGTAFATVSCHASSPAL